MYMVSYITSTIFWFIFLFFSELGPNKIYGGTLCDNMRLLKAVNYFKKEVNISCYGGPSSAFTLPSFVRFYDNQLK